MRNKSVIKYFRKVKGQIEIDQFKTIEKELFKVPENQLEALWNFLVAGYSVNFAIQNYINLFEYARDNSLEYTDAIEAFRTISFGITAGTGVNQLRWFDLN